MPRRITSLYPGVVQAVAVDGFENGFAPFWTQWNGVQIGSACGSFSGDALLFNGAAPRLAVAGPLDLSQGGTIRWKVRAMDGSQGCDAPEPVDQLTLEYSTNGGLNWTNILLLDPTLYTQWTAIDVPVPPGAMQPSVLLRWRETNALTVGDDIWVIDDVAVVTSSIQGLTFAWAPAIG